MTAAELPERVTIRRVEPDDLIDVSRIESDVFPQPWPSEAFQRFVDEPGFLVAETTNRAADADSEGPGNADGIVGYVVADVVTRYGADIGHVKDLAVTPEYRRVGVGRALLDRALSALADQDVSGVKLEVRESNDAAQALYEQFGFRLRKRLPGYYANGEDALVFVMELDA